MSEMMAKMINWSTDLSDPVMSRGLWEPLVFDDDKRRRYKKTFSESDARMPSSSLHAYFTSVVVYFLLMLFCSRWCSVDAFMLLMPWIMPWISWSFLTLTQSWRCKHTFLDEPWIKEWGRRRMLLELHFIDRIHTAFWKMVRKEWVKYERASQLLGFNVTCTSRCMRACIFVLSSFNVFSIWLRMLQVCHVLFRIQVGVLVPSLEKH